MEITTLKKLAIPQAEILEWLTLELQEMGVIGLKDHLTKYSPEFIADKSQFEFTVEPVPEKPAVKEAQNE